MQRLQPGRHLVIHCDSHSRYIAQCPVRSSNHIDADTQQLCQWNAVARVGQHLQEPHSLSNPTTANIPIPTATVAITTLAALCAATAVPANRSYHPCKAAGAECCDGT